LATDQEEFLQKATEHWAGALSEQAAGRYSTALALAYYACFLTVLAEHIRRNLPPDQGRRYSHSLVYRTASMLLNEYGRPDLLWALPRLFSSRIQAQYTGIQQTESWCATMMKLTEDILGTLGGRTR
jgi:hypothetical protein